MAFLTLDLSLEAIRRLRLPLERLRLRDRDLAEQIRRAASSVVLNIGEGNERVGRDRIYHFRVAAASASEVRAALWVAMGWGDLSASEAQPIVDIVSRVIRMLWKLTGRP